MYLTVHRSAHEIGGNCIEIESNGHRLLLDAGFPLDPDLRGKQAKEVLPPSLDLNKPIDALLLSHPHKDHYGLLSALPSDLEVWCGQSAKALIEINSELFNESTSQAISSWTHYRIVRFGPFKITPFLTDHSAFDAYMILVECENKKILYTGDFRITGRKSKMVDAMIHNPPNDIDALLMEGTTLGRNDKYPTEADIENQFVDLFKKKNGRIFITWSAQNIDRTVSIYRACLRSKRILVLDLYSSYILNRLNHNKESIPTLGWKNLKCVVTSDRINWFKKLGKTDFIGKRCVPNGISAKKLQDDPKKWVVFTQAGLQSDFDRNLTLSMDDLWVYSMWLGYLNDDNNKIIQLKSWFNEAGVQMKYIHTSGHASKTDLIKFSEALSPKALIPIHSFDWDNHLGSFKNIVRLKDGEPYQL
jgi:ribonuclease J